MKLNLKQTTKLIGPTDPIEEFVRRVLITLITLVLVSSVVVLLLIYMPLKTELEKSLVDNFSQISYIRYAALQNNINRGLEGARSLSSRTVIRDAIVDYLDGKITLDELTIATQSKYEDGARVLEYLIRAERFVDNDLVASYTVERYEEELHTNLDDILINDKSYSALSLTGGHEYFVTQSPITSQGQIIGYDKLVFDLSNQIQILCTKMIKSELVNYNDFQDLILNAKILKDGDVS